VIETMWTESDLSVMWVSSLFHLPHVRGGQPQARDISLPIGIIVPHNEGKVHGGEQCIIFIIIEEIQEKLVMQAYSSR